MDKIPRDILLFTGPTVPPLCRSKNHSCFGPVFQDMNLLLEFMWKPNIICIKKSDVFSFGIGDTQIARGAHPPILVGTMLEIVNVVWMLICITVCNRCAVVGRAIVHEEQFPMRISLCEDALDSFLDKPLFI